MSIFWQIYHTIFLFTVILAIVGGFIDSCENEKGPWLMVPCVIQLLLYLLLVLLDLIWDWSWF